MRWAAIVVVILVGMGDAAAQRTDVTIKIERPRITGAYDRVIVQRYLRREQNKFVYCYERALVRAGKLAATKLTVRFAVEPDGRTSGVRVEGVADEVENCVASALRRLQLPRIDKIGTAASVVTTRFTFTMLEPLPPPKLGPLPPCLPGSLCAAGRGPGPTVGR